MTTNDKPRVTMAEFWDIVNLPENADRTFELIDGEIVDVAPSSDKNSHIAAKFLRFIDQYLDDHPLGFVTGADGGYTMVNGDVVLPDAAFVSHERQPQFTGKHSPVAPDLAVEVVSESNSAPQMRRRIHLYLESGTRLVWVVYPDAQVVDVVQQDAAGDLLSRSVGLDGTLEGGEVLPGFTLAVRKVFPG